MDTLVKDIRYAARNLIKRPAFTVVAVITLALGIGVNTTIFSLANSVFLRPLPVVAPQNLVWVFTDRENPTSYPDYLEYHNHNDLFDGVLAYDWVGLNLGNSGQAERVQGALVSGDYFNVLGVKAELGRTILPDDDQPAGVSPVAVISHSLWQRRFNSDLNVIGKPVVLNGHDFTVVGVAPNGFVGTEEAFPRDIWIPLMMSPQMKPGFAGARGGPNVLNDRNARWLNVMGRLKPGVSLRQAQAGMDLVATQLAQAYPQTNTNHPISLYSAGNGRPVFRARLGPVTKVLLAVVGLVLLIACANVANLLLARAARRRKEVAIRLTLGATRARLIRQLLTESILLAFLGGGVGLVLNFWVTDLLTKFKPTVPLPLNVEFHTDWRVLSFTLALSLVAGIVFGLVPALQASNHRLVPALKDERHEFGSNRRFFSLRNLLVMGQVTISIVVLVSAGLFLRSLGHARAIEPGFDANHVLTLTFNTAAQGYDAAKASQFYQQLTARVQSLPGVQAVSLAQSTPLSYFYAPALAAPTVIEGHEPPVGENPPMIGNNIIGPNFFQTLGISLLKGRDFNDQDRDGAPRVAIINETVARRFFSNEEPLGRKLRVMRGPQTLRCEIVAVVKDSKYLSLGEDPTAYIFMPFLQNPQPSMALQVRTGGAPQELVATVRREVQALDQNLPPFNVMTLADNINISLFPARFGALLLGAFGLVALLIASVGIYGVMSYGVSERTHEMGIRMALGARGGDVLRLVISQGMWLVLVGVVVGAGLALISTRVLSSYLYDVSVSDPVTFVAIALLLIAVAFLACYVPARRATKVDPLVALRYE
jgi:putative ABC transport system permease protein